MSHNAGSGVAAVSSNAAASLPAGSQLTECSCEVVCVVFAGASELLGLLTPVSTPKLSCRMRHNTHVCWFRLCTAGAG